MSGEDEQIRRLLRTLDHDLPDVTVRSIAVRVRRRRLLHLRRAAVVLLALGVAGIAAAAPGSPVRAWLAGAAQRVLDSREPESAVQAPAAAGAGGIAMATANDLTIEFVELTAGARARVAISDEHVISVEAADVGATFAAAAERLLVRGGASVLFELRIPRSAPHVEIRAGGVTLFVVEAGTVTSTARPDAHGEYMLRLAPPLP